ncbi:MAG TPA: thioesterase family protein [Acidimicrobiales bacterium]|nr:thioesterase family protein [Acidimicrobiales bacterium]
MSTTHTGAQDAFDTATAVTLVGDGAYSAELDEAYGVLGKPNGGYLLAVLARAAAAHAVAQGTRHAHCLAASALYVRAPSCARVDLAVTVHRSGARVSQLRATLSQDGRVAVDAVVSCGRLDRDDEVRLVGPPPPALPPPEACERVEAGGPPGEGVSIMDRVELRLDPATTGFRRGELASEAEVRGWLRLADGRAPDPLSLLFCLDALPPATFPIGSSGWVPTIQLSAYVRALPADGWLRARQVARTVAGGLVDEVCELWDADGRVVAQATQLAMVRF